MHSYPTTHQILLDRARNVIDCERCIAWAVGMLVEGSEVHSLCILAGETPRTCVMTIERLRDEALEELGFARLGTFRGICQAIILRNVSEYSLKGDFRPLLRDAAGGYLNGVKELRTLYLLHHAWKQLDDFGSQHYISDMTPESAEEFTRKEVDCFIARHEFKRQEN